MDRPQRACRNRSAHRTGEQGDQSEYGGCCGAFATDRMPVAKAGDLPEAERSRKGVRHSEERQSFRAGL